MVGSIGRLGSYGGGGGDVASSVITGALGITTSILDYAGGAKALKGQLLLADAQAKNDAATAQQNYKTAQIQLQQTQLTTAAQIQAAQLSAGGSAKTAMTIVASLTGVMLLGVGGVLLYKWAVK